MTSKKALRIQQACTQSSLPKFLYYNYQHREPSTLVITTLAEVASWSRGMNEQVFKKKKRNSLREQCLKSTHVEQMHHEISKQDLGFW